jgi:hypothetical protein
VALDSQALENASGRAAGTLRKHLRYYIVNCCAYLAC